MICLSDWTFLASLSVGDRVCISPVLYFGSYWLCPECPRSSKFLLRTVCVGSHSTNICLGLHCSSRLQSRACLFRSSVHALLCSTQTSNNYVFAPLCNYSQPPFLKEHNKTSQCSDHIEHSIVVSDTCPIATPQAPTLIATTQVPDGPSITCFKTFVHRRHRPERSMYT